METHLLQQAHLLQVLDAALDRTRKGGPAMALMLVGLGRLDFIDRNLGFAGGDAVLDEVARLLRNVRPDCPVFNLRDARYALIVPCEDASAAMNMAQSLVALCSSPHRIGDFEVFSPPFIGVAMIVPAYESGDAVLRDALIAMDDARRSHLGCARLFEPGSKGESDRRLHLENDMRAAFETDQFHVVYQPLMKLPPSGDIGLLGFEALLRWNHPQFGAVPPDHFIPIAEECGLIKGLGHFVLWTACRQQVAWAAATGRTVTMSVNISPVQLMAAGIEDSIAEAVAETGIDPHHLKLEVTETALVVNPTLLAEKLKHIKALGVSVGVDDFGSGYSSLGQLDLFGLDFMKIDKSLIQRLGPGERQTELVRLATALAQHLGMFVVAEGIEDQEHLNALMTLGINVGQGYLFDRPLPPQQAAQWLTVGKWPARPGGL